MRTNTHYTRVTVSSATAPHVQAVQAVLRGSSFCRLHSSRPLRHPALLAWKDRREGLRDLLGDGQPKSDDLQQLSCYK